MRIETIFYLFAIVHSCEDLLPGIWPIAFDAYIVKTGTVLKISCQSAQKYPSYNNGELLKKVKCVENKWNWPRGFDNLKCAYVSCPPAPQFPNISQRCLRETDDGNCVHSEYNCEKETSTQKRPALSQKDGFVDKNITFWSLRCLREGSTKYGQWGFNGAYDAIQKGYVTYIVMSSSPVKCVDYVGCASFKNAKPQVSSICRNTGNGYNGNCDTILFDCPKGMTPSVPSVSCKRVTDQCCQSYGGKWKFEDKKLRDKVHCLKEAEPKQCSELPSSYYDDSITVSCEENNSKCTFICNQENMTPSVTKVKCKKGQWSKMKKIATCEK